MRTAILGLSSVGLVHGIKAWVLQSLHTPAGAPGWRHLSLPIELIPVQDLLRGWDCFSCSDFVIPEPETVPRTDQIPGPVTDDPMMPEMRIQLAGFIDQGLNTLYCFFDKENNRWLRLSCGTSDQGSGFMLEESPAGPLLVDVKNAARYLVDRQLCRLIRTDVLEGADEIE